MVCHALEGYRNGDTISRCTRAGGARDAQGADTIIGFVVSSDIYGYIPCLCSIVVSSRPILVREMILFCGLPAVALNHSMNGFIRWVIPIASVFVCIMCHALEFNRNVATISGCTRERGSRYAQGTNTLSGILVICG